MQMWQVWYPNAAADGLLLGRGKIDATDVLWLHTAPEVVRVEVYDHAGQRIALGDQLAATAETGPMTRLVRNGDTVEREDRWPNEDDLGSLVMLPGGEVGHLTAWWHAPDRSEWRWSVEFYNHR